MTFNDTIFWGMMFFLTVVLIGYLFNIFMEKVLLRKYHKRKEK